MTDPVEPPKEKSRVSYPADLKERAKREGRGLATIQVQHLDGTRYQVQVVADLDEIQFTKWAAALLGRPDVRPLPALMETARAVAESRGITE